MTLQLIGTGEPFTAEQPVANERSLAGMPPEVRLEMGRLPVDLVAPGIMANVRFLQGTIYAPESVFLAQAVGALAFDASSRFSGVIDNLLRLSVGVVWIKISRGGRLRLSRPWGRLLVATGRGVGWGWRMLEPELVVGVRVSIGLVMGRIVEWGTGCVA